MENLNCKDLMVGDWLCYEGERNIQVKGIDCSPNGNSAYISFGAEFYPCDDFSPIPLTPEILEKNEFYYGFTSNEEDLASNTIVHISEDDKGWCWDEGGGAIKVVFPNETDGGLLVIDDQSFDRYLKFYYSAIYVHELQHIMRLFEIEKEIIL